MAKKKNKLKLGIRGILGIGCLALWLICVYAQIREDLGIAHQKQVPYRFMDSLGPKPYFLPRTFKKDAGRYMLARDWASANKGAISCGV